MVQKMHLSHKKFLSIFVNGHDKFVFIYEMT